MRGRHLHLVLLHLDEQRGLLRDLVSQRPRLGRQGQLLFLQAADLLLQPVVVLHQLVDPLSAVLEGGEMGSKYNFEYSLAEICRVKGNEGRWRNWN